MSNPSPPVLAIALRVFLSCGHVHLAEHDARPAVCADRSCDVCGALAYVRQVRP